jgi:hypothetical protein
MQKILYVTFQNIRLAILGVRLTRYTDTYSDPKTPPKMPRTYLVNGIF